VCDPEHLPPSHKIHAWIERKPFGGEWTQASGRTPLVFDIPDEEGFDIKVSTTCQDGAYRSGYEAVGRGPASPGNPSGNP